MAAAAQCAAPTPMRYPRRRPERTPWYRVVQPRLQTRLELAGGDDGEAPPAHVERTFRRDLECGILAHGFARACCDECQHDFLIAYSCKCRGVCSSCNTRRMAETAAYLVDHASPPLPVREWMLAVPKRLRYFLQRDAARAPPRSMHRGRISECHGCCHAFAYPPSRLMRSRFHRSS